MARFCPMLRPKHAISRLITDQSQLRTTVLHLSTFFKKIKTCTSHHDELCLRPNKLVQFGELCTLNCKCMNNLKTCACWRACIWWHNQYSTDGYVCICLCINLRQDSQHSFFVYQTLTDASVHLAIISVITESNTSTTSANSPINKVFE